MGAPVKQDSFGPKLGKDPPLVQLLLGQGLFVVEMAGMEKCPSETKWMMLERDRASTSMGDRILTQPAALDSDALDAPSTRLNQVTFEEV
ncbi:hypothetical protein JD844_013803, partial [Phrynosoma platyrhinos]